MLSQRLRPASTTSVPASTPSVYDQRLRLAYTLGFGAHAQAWQMHTLDDWISNGSMKIIPKSKD